MQQQPIMAGLEKPRETKYHSVKSELWQVLTTATRKISEENGHRPCYLTHLAYSMVREQPALPISSIAMRRGILPHSDCPLHPIVLSYSSNSGPSSYQSGLAIPISQPFEQNAGLSGNYLYRCGGTSGGWRSLCLFEKVKLLVLPNSLAWLSSQDPNTASNCCTSTSSRILCLSLVPYSFVGHGHFRLRGEATDNLRRSVYQEEGRKLPFGPTTVLLLGGQHQYRGREGTLKLLLHPGSPTIISLDGQTNRGTAASIFDHQIRQRHQAPVLTGVHPNRGLPLQLRRLRQHGPGTVLVLERLQARHR